MIEVRIRHQNDGTARHLCTWPVRHLDELIPMIDGWGVLYEYESDLVYTLSGAIVVADGGAFFELLITPRTP